MSKHNTPKLNMIQTSQLILLDAFLSSKLNWGCGQNLGSNGYADLVLNGNPETHLKTVTKYKPVD